MRRCLIYTRVSTFDQEAENQVGQLAEYARRQEWEVVDTIKDTCSGGKGATEREGLSRVFQMSHRKQYDILLFWSLDRLSREGSRRTIEHLTQLESCGVDWHSFNEPYLSSLGIFKDCVIAILSALAKQERIRISERTKAGLERTRRINHTRLGRPPTPPSRLKLAVQLRASGLSYGKIAREMGVGRSRAFEMVQEGSSLSVA